MSVCVREVWGVGCSVCMRCVCVWCVCECIGMRVCGMCVCGECVCVCVYRDACECGYVCVVGGVNGTWLVVNMIIPSLPSSSLLWSRPILTLSVCRWLVTTV